MGVIDAFLSLRKNFLLMIQTWAFIIEIMWTERSITSLEFCHASSVLKANYYLTCFDVAMTRSYLSSIQATAATSHKCRGWKKKTIYHIFEMKAIAPYVYRQQALIELFRVNFETKFKLLIHNHVIKSF